MKVKSKEKIQEWVYSQIESWAQDNYESAESWSTGEKDRKKAEQERVDFIKTKKQEFDKMWNEK